MDTFKDVIGKFGTAETLAREIGEKGVTVRAWGNRGNIPMEYWPQIVNAAEKAGVPEITVDRLMLIAMGRKAKADPAEREDA